MTIAFSVFQWFQMGCPWLDVIMELCRIDPDMKTNQQTAGAGWGKSLKFHKLGNKSQVRY